ncbi:PAS domain S-box protein [Aliarcobacter cibarius]|uniref:histidine kinase n=1 Tax=Aliarcobacter cibarius TaxID=255507 RepID=A0ABY2V4I0_9BACT|nr:PAS domain S-box protein [Aliarcobacter cibarius]TLS99222.1 PAS domain S-box protein [Aliarcobacter cibarius]TLT00365.1 PAS domain S-box protein [Aliarcobacter cibarius]
MKNRTLIVSFLLPFLITIITIMSFYTVYNYFETKNRLINDINLRMNSISKQLNDSLPHFINSYAISEYKKLIENQMQDNNILAIIVKDYSYGKIFGKEFIESGKIREFDKILDFDREYANHNNLLNENFSYIKTDLIDNFNTKIAEIELYSSSNELNTKLNEIVKKSIFEIIILSLFIIILVFFIIKTLILKPIFNMVDAIQNNDKYGIPKENIPENNRVKELNELSKKMNEMISTIKNSRYEISQINNKMELIINSINDGIWDWNLKTNEVYYSNQWKKILGFNDDEIKNDFNEWKSRVNPEHFENIEKDLNYYLESKSDIFKNEHQILCKDGSYKWILNRGIIVNRDEDGNPLRMIGTHTDITFIKDLQKQIIKEKDFISNIIDNSNVIIAVIDNKGRMFKVNKFTQEFTGYSQDEIASVPFFWVRFLHKNVQVKINEIVEEAKKGNIKKYFKASCFSKNNEEKIFEWSNTLIKKADGSIDYIVTIGIDVTEKEIIQKEILQQKEELELIFNYSKDGIAILDLNTRFLNFNDSFLNMTGFSKNELLEKTVFQLVAKKDDEKNKRIINQILEEGFVNNFEETFAFKDKRVITNLSISLLPNKETLLMIIKDVSSLKVLQEQTKLASLGEMIGNIAHQWRQPLSFISISASSLKVKSEFNILTKEEINETSTAIVKQTEYLSNTIDNFRDFIKEDKSYTNISIKEVLDNSLNLVYASLNNNFINLTLELDDDLSILGNKNELTEAFLNIISNSKDALKEKKEEDRFLFIKSKKLNENRLKLKFLDSGGGIDEEIISKVLEPYFTTKHKSQGTGLGLSIVDKIVRERHKGTIEIYNEEFTHNQKIYKGLSFNIIFEKIEI